MARRFDVGKHLKYDSSYAFCESRSRILHPKKEGVDFLGIEMADLRGCQNILQTLRGDENGDLADSEGRRCASRIKMQQAVVTQIEQDIKYRKTTALMEGRSSVPNDDPQCYDEWLTETARLDVLLAEAEVLHRRIAALESEKQKIESKLLKRKLRHPTGSGKLDDGKLISIDGQHVSFIDERAIIDDKRSPYDQMPVEQYRLEIVPRYRRIRP